MIVIDDLPYSTKEEIKQMEEELHSKKYKRFLIMPSLICVAKMLAKILLGGFIFMEFVCWMLCVSVMNTHPEIFSIIFRNFSTKLIVIVILEIGLLSIWFAANLYYDKYFYKYEHLKIRSKELKYIYEKSAQILRINNFITTIQIKDGYLKTIYYNDPIHNSLNELTVNIPIRKIDVSKKEPESRIYVKSYGCHVIYTLNDYAKYEGGVFIEN